MAEWLSNIPRSYWQRGCDDAKAERMYSPPTAEADWEGYRKGYAYGKTLCPPCDTKVGTPGVGGTDAR